MREVRNNILKLFDFLILFLLLFRVSFLLYGRCYKYVATGLDWADAVSYCVTQGANLASVHSEAEHQLIKTLIKTFDPLEFYTWIGLSDVVKEGRWMWTDGSKVDFTDWFKSDPDGGKAQNCVNTNYQMLWIDNECSEGYAFVCAERLC
uniref:C-type lectin domain-containing protein n=1 Tax=Oncorhynchus tshawytscha TaxID=74940 RepID=A0A8C8HZS6_ONCTS